MIEYLGEIETEFENTLACLSGAQMHGFKQWRKKVDTLPLCGRPTIHYSIKETNLIIQFSLILTAALWYD